MAAAVRRCCPWGRGRARDPALLEDGTELGFATGSFYASSSSSKTPSQMGMEMLQKGYRVLEKARDTPEGFQELLSDLRVRLGRLEGALSSEATKEDKVCMVLPWPKPGAEDEAAWRQLCPTGGKLLRTQVCVAAEGDSPDWFVGRLFVSQVGVLFEGCAGMTLGEDALDTGLIRWPDVVRWTESKGSMLESSTMNEVILSIRDAKPIASLRLQLGFDLDCNCLHEVWRMSSDALPPDAPEGGAREAEGGAEDCPSVRRRRSRRTHFDFASDLLGPEDEDEASSRGRPRMEPSKSVLSAAEVMPSPAEVKSLPPLCSADLPSVTLDRVRRAWEKDEGWPLEIFTREILKAWDIAFTPWAEGKRTPGLMRRIRFKMPSPDDIPPAMARMVGLPRFFENVAVVRLQCTETEVALVMHTVTVNMSFGDATRVQDIIVFSALPGGGGGVKITKWTHLVIVKTLPFYLRAAHSVMESKVRAAAVDTFLEYRDLMGRLMS